jgi:hypothetical protein
MDGSDTSLSASQHDTHGMSPMGSTAFLQHGSDVADDFDLVMMAELDSIDWAQESLLLNFT